ncbi:MAG: endonuclease/exonuclease/phosphatase family protein [Phycisphaerales bacterium JB059]
MSEQRRQGPIAWFRRTGLSALARLIALAGLLAVILWGVGRWFNDDHLWSHILCWITNGLVALFDWVTLLLSALCSKLSLRMGGVKLRPFLAVGAILVTVWMLLAWRPMNVLQVFDRRAEPGLRVAYWNISVEHDAADAGDIILAQRPDIAILANIRNDEHRGSILEAMGSLVPEGSEGVHFRAEVNVTVSGRYPIRRWGMARPRRVTTRLTEWRSEWDTGRIVFIEFELTPPARERLGMDTLVVWVVDLPSDPSMRRAEVMQAAANAVGEWKGPAVAPDHLGRWRQAPLPEGETGFPEPDLIIGDFNTPRASRSLRTLVADARSTHDQAGLGPGGTWMRSLPLWAIDQAFTGRRVRAVRSRVIDPGISEHRMVVVELDRAGD